MDRTIIGRMAAGVCCICLCYGLVMQAVQGKPESGTQSTNPAAAAQTDKAAPEHPKRPYEWTPGEQYKGEFHNGATHRHGHEHRGSFSRDEQKPRKTPTPSGTEEDGTAENKKKKTEEQEQDSSGNSQNSGASGDPPALSQFLSTLRCGGCGHNCSLLNPRCMKGRSKAERAQTQYEQTYGSDNND